MSTPLKPCPYLLAKVVDGASRAGDVDMPESPAVAGRRALHRRPHLVDRAAMVAQSIGGGQ